jgi:hypothetical protein
MFGLTFAAFLSLIVTPVMYAIFFSVQEQPLVAHPEQQDGEPPRMPRPSMAPKT